MHSSHETADPRLVAALTAEAPDAIARLERFGVAFTHDADGRYRLARCGGATRKRLLQVGDRTGHAIATALRGAVGADERIETLDHAPLQALDAGCRRAGARRSGSATASSLAVSRRRDRAGGRRALLRRGQAPRHVLHERRRRDRRGDRDRARSRLRGARPRRAAVPPERRPLAGHDAGLLDPRDDACLRRRCCSTPTASASSTSSAGATSWRPRSCASARRGAASRRPRAGRRCCSTAARSRSPTPRSRCRTCSSATARPASIRSRSRSTPIPVLHYQNGGLVIDEHGATTVAGLYAAGEISRRRARPQPHDGQLAARRLGLRLARRARRRRRGRVARSTTTPIYQSRAGILGGDEHRKQRQRLSRPPGAPGQAARDRHHPRHGQGPVARCRSRA